MKLGGAEGIETKDGPDQEDEPEKKEGTKNILHSPPCPVEDEKNQEGKKDDIFFRKERGQVKERGYNQTKRAPFLQKFQEKQQGKRGEKEGKKVRTAGNPGYVFKVGRENGKEQCA